MPTLFVPREQSDAARADVHPAQVSSPGSVPLDGAETRVATVPETIRKLKKDNWTVVVEPGAGMNSSFLDVHYKDAGAELGTRWDADVVAKVSPPRKDEIGRMRPGGLLIGFIAAHRNLEAVRTSVERKVDVWSMELVPRITRAQSMDALSSQANIAGYKAVILAANELGKYFPLLMTAAGTIQPARVVVMGAGVAGLQAIATARRLGAIVEVSDVRAAVKEQVLSLGAKFIEVPMTESAEGAGGYAKEVSAEFLEKQRTVLKEKIAAADVVICTALVPGKPAPKLVSKDMVEAMRPGSVIIDLAVTEGGNCELSSLGQKVITNGVVIVGHPNLVATVPVHASLVYSRNVATVLSYIAKGGDLKLDMADEVVKGSMLVHQGTVNHAPTAELLAKGS